MTSAASVALGDVDNDGDGDLVLSSVAGQLPKLLIRSRSTRGETEDTVGVPSVFRDDARTWGVADESSIALEHWSTHLADLNNDGWLDLFMANGLRTPDPVAAKIAQGQAKSFWLNRAGTDFLPVDITTQFALDDRVPSRGSVVADFDNNGALDVYVSNNNELGQLLLNSRSQSGHYFAVQLVGTQGNRDALGARLTLRSPAGNQQRELSHGGAFLSQSDRRVHFGLGDYAGPVALEIEWPNGEQQTFVDLATDRYVRVIQGRTRSEDLPMQPPDNASGAPYKVVDLAQIVTALAHPDPTVRRETIDVLRQREDELSSRWLLRAFKDPDPSVRIALAEAFAFLFHEEEAMVHRKRLAIPHLVRLLEDTDARVRIAAANALGEAENFRGLYPLIDHLADSSFEVQAAAARALGKIRERHAIGHLQHVVQDGARPTAVRAHALIALKRLNDETLEATWTTMEKQSFASGTEEQIAEVFRIAHLIATDHEDGIVYNPSHIAERARRCFKVLQDADQLSLLSRAGRLAYLDVIAATVYHEARADAVLLAKDPDAEVKARALGVLAKLDRQRPYRG